ncbi:MAG TPA: hypothetical protein VLH75_09965 [Longimicrobiales bacterium]|nr:hypothetical protein [Longimicrobiales bacterium]
MSARPGAVRPLVACVPGGEGGFVLPVALFVLVVLAMVSVTGLYTSRNEYRAAEATRQAAVALAAADAGAQRTLALWATAVPALPAAGDSLLLDWQTLPDGSRYRSVVRRAPVAVGGTAAGRVLMRTIAVVRPPGTARRTVVTVVEAPSGQPLCCEAAFKVQSRLLIRSPGKPKPDSYIRGADSIPPGWTAAQCPGARADLPGVVTSDAAQIDVRAGGSISGSPAIQEDTTVADADFADLGPITYAALAAQAKFTFPGGTRLNNTVNPVVAGGTCSTGVNTNWGSPLTPLGPCGSWAPIVRATGNLRLSGAGQGQGVLLVDGNLTIDGTFQYYGLVIVLGSVSMTTTSRISGGVLIRGGVGGGLQSELADGAIIQYSSCAVQRAQAGITGMTPGGGATGATERSWFEVVG